MTPINIDPSNPAMPISSEDYSKELYKKAGFYYTQGMAEDTKVLSDEILSDVEYSQQALFVLDDALRIYDIELDRFKNKSNAFLFFYFSSVDLNSHMMWRLDDPAHPKYDADSAKDPNVIRIHSLYEIMDEALAKAMALISDEDTLIVMSDHGFAPFYRSFHVNTWLWKNGYITKKDMNKSGSLFGNVIWSKTLAYSMGFNGIYINKRGREKYGSVVEGAQSEKLIEEICSGLADLTDQQTGEKVFTTAYKSKEIYTGDVLQYAPDIVLGYARGYRSSWETALGDFPIRIFYKITKTNGAPTIAWIQRFCRACFCPISP